MKKIFIVFILLVYSIMLVACSDSSNDKKYIINMDDPMFNDTMKITSILDSVYDSLEDGHDGLEYLYNEDATVETKNTTGDEGTVKRKKLPNKELQNILNEYVKKYKDVEGEQKRKVYNKVVKAIELMPKYVEINNKDIDTLDPEYEERQEFNSEYLDLIHSITTLLSKKH